MTDAAPATATQTGVLLINLGTPEAPTKAALKRYLREFLSDRRVVELPRWLWRPILHGVILPTRPAKSAEKYAAIWTADGSPLLMHTRRQAKLLQGYLGERRTPSPPVVFAMRYGAPSIDDGVRELLNRGCRRILAFPLYPQYAAATTASACDALFQAFMRQRDQPALRIIRDYHDHPAYIGALAAAIRTHWSHHGRPNKLLMSFHGIPRFAAEKGDPYPAECRRTASLLTAALALDPEQTAVTFQSRFGRTEWIKPYTVDTLKQFAKNGLHRVDVVCPGFSADCLETLEEIAIEGKAVFLNHGGQTFHYIPALNERPEWIAAMRDIALQNLAGWAPTPAA
ncbi:MAG TPA: ferrochelatase [Betaproteobacteria bacterium]|nr:ferrochelatase [Betaproteobacteria bacterium]